MHQILHQGNLWGMEAVAVCARSIAITKRILVVVVLTGLAIVASYCLLALVLTVMEDGGSVGGRLAFCGIFILLPLGGYAFLIARMAARHDLGLTHRLAWICALTAFLGLWFVVFAVATQPII